MTRWERFMLTVVFIYVVAQMLAGTAALSIVLWETWP